MRQKVSIINIFRMVFMPVMLFLVGETFFHWSGFSYYLTFWEFLPNLAMMVLLFTLMAILATVILKAVEAVVRVFNKSIDFKVIYAWMFLVVLSFVMVKMFKLWADSFMQIPYWNVTKYLVLAFILTASTVLAWKLREKLTAVITERFAPLFWLFIFISVCSAFVVIHHSVDSVEADVLERPAALNSSDGQSTRPNIILVSMDALSAGDMSLYGYERRTTPFLEELAGESHLFTRFYANSNFTTPSIVSMLTSKYPWSHQVYQLKGTIDEHMRSENMIRVFRENGYTTMAFVVNRWANPYQLELSGDFDLVIPDYELWVPHKISTFILLTANRLIGDKFSVSWWWLRYYVRKIFAAEVNDKSEFPVRLAFDAFFDHVSDSRRPFFAWIHLLPPHFPYLPPVPYKNTFAEIWEMPGEKAQWGNWGHYADSKQGKIDSLRKRYDEFILYCDAEFRGFVDKLKKRGLYDNSLLIFTSDHGDMFEKGFFAHNGPYLYEPLVHIPMIIHEPGQTEGSKVDTLGTLIDVAPTLTDYIGLPVPEWMEGESVLPAIRGDTLLSRPKFSMWLEKNRALNHPIINGTVAVIEGDFKLIYYIKEDRSELYNIRHDPGEENELKDEEPLVAQRLKSIILNRIRQINASRNG